MKSTRPQPGSNFFGVSLVFLTSILGCGASSRAARTTATETAAPDHVIWSNGSMVLEESVQDGLLHFTLSTLDEDFFTAIGSYRWPSNRCSAVGDARSETFDCYVDFGDQWIRVALERSPEGRGLTLIARSNGCEMLPELGSVSLTRTLATALIGPHFVRGTLANQDVAAEASCASEFGEASPQCPTLRLLLGSNGEALLSTLVSHMNRWETHDSSIWWGTIDTWFDLHTVLQRAIGHHVESTSPLGALSHADIAQAVSDYRSLSQNHQNTSEPLPEFISSPGPETLGVWMPRRPYSPDLPLTFFEFTRWQCIPAGAVCSEAGAVNVLWTSSGVRCGARLSPLNDRWQTFECDAKRFRIRRVSHRLEVRDLNRSFGSEPYQTFFRVDPLREAFRGAAISAGHSTGSETTAVLDGVMDAVMGSAPGEQAERMYAVIQQELIAARIRPEDLTLVHTQELVGEYLLTLGVTCSERTRGQHSPQLFSTCVSENLSPLARALVGRFRANQQD